MSPEERELISTSNRVMVDHLWGKCKAIRNDKFMFKAALLVIRKMKRRKYEKIKDPKKKQENYEEWAEGSGPMVRHLINERRSYVNGRFADVYINVLSGGDGNESKRKRGSASAKSNAPVDVTKPKTLVYPDWLPLPQDMLQIAMRDPQAWGYDEYGDLVNPGAKAAMDKRFAFYWDKLITMIVGVRAWSIDNRCHNNLSDKIHASTEALAVWMLESNYDRWMTRAMFDISYPERRIYKKDDGSYLNGLENLQMKYTDPSGGRQPNGGLTEAGRKRLDDLTKMIEENRRENQVWIAHLETRVRKIVHKDNGQVEIEEKKKARRRSKPVKMASTTAAIDEGVVDFNDLTEW